MNRIQSKNHKIGTYKINNFLYHAMDDNIYILNNGYNVLALRVDYVTKFISIKIYKKLAVVLVRTTFSLAYIKLLKVR